MNEEGPEVGDTAAPRRRRLPRWGWWHRQRPVTRRVIRGSVAIVLSGLGAAVIGLFSASTTSSLGPHVAHYATSVRHDIVIDIGPLGAILFDSPLPWPLGVDVTVEEIPAELHTVPTDPLTGLAEDLAAYGQVFSEPRAATAEAVDGLISDAVGRTVLIWSATLLVMAAGRFASRGLLRREVAAALRRRGVAPVLTVLIVSLASLQVMAITTQRHVSAQPLTALAGTPLEGVRMTGQMAAVANTYGGELVDAYDDNEAFYDEVVANLQDSYAEDEAEQEAVPEGAEPVTALMVADLHCNVGMARVIGEALSQSDAQLLLDAGDTAMSGTEVESYCINSFASAIPDDIPAVVSPGNHDSITTAEQMADAGYIVLHGEPVTVDGLRILGDTDPMLTSVGQGTISERDELFGEMGQRLADRAAEAREEDEPIDVLLAHNPYATTQSLEDGVVPLALSGHRHRRQGPELEGEGVSYVSATSAGAVPGGATLGPLRGRAEMTLLRIDAASGQPLDYRIIGVEPDASVDLSSWNAFPEAHATEHLGPGGQLEPREDEPAESPSPVETPTGEGSPTDGSS